MRSISKGRNSYGEKLGKNREDNASGGEQSILFYPMTGRQSNKRKDWNVGISQGSMADITIVHKCDFLLINTLETRRLFFLLCEYS